MYRIKQLLSKPTFMVSTELSLNTFKYKNDIEYCGPTSAQMILDFLNGWGGKPHILQEEIYRIIRAKNIERSLATDPYGLAKCLNQLGSPLIRWRVYSAGEGSQEKATRKIINTIETHHHPSVVLTDQGNHWVVVCGFKIKKFVLSKKPYEIIDIRIRNPEPKDNGKVISYMEWIKQNNWFSKNLKGKKWKNKYVFVYPEIVQLKKGKITKRIKSTIKPIFLK